MDQADFQISEVPSNNVNDHFLSEAKNWLCNYEL